MSLLALAALPLGAGAASLEAGLPAAAAGAPPAAASAARGAPLRALAEGAGSHRLAHARELMGKYYDRSVVRAGERVADVGAFVLETTRRSFRGKTAKWKPRAEEIAGAIVSESARYRLDPLFVLAVIETESGFRPDVRGPMGEIGLMQLRPRTAEWLRERLRLPHLGRAGLERELEDPVANVRLGAAYLAYLRDEFESHGRLYVAAYNMGPENVRKTRARDAWPATYPTRVMKRYVRLYRTLARSAMPPSEPGRSIAWAWPGGIR